MILIEPGSARAVLTAAEAGDRLGLSAATVHRMGLDGRLERVEVRSRTGREFFYPLDAVDRLVQTRGGRRTVTPRRPRRDAGETRGPASDGWTCRRLRDVRRRRGMTTRELALLAGVGHPTVVNAEKPGRAVYRTTVGKLAEALGVPVLDIADYVCRA